MAAKAKHQRLMLVVAAVAAMIGAALLAASGLKDQAAFFYTPGDVRTKGIEPGKVVRLGGMVVNGSLHRAADGVTLGFQVTDGRASVPVRFHGVAPDLFREGSGVIADGKFEADGSFTADELLAKHDERYMPRELKGISYDPRTHKVTATP
jgi:cytochrome c-type biogenesis protein CcmE